MESTITSEIRLALRNFNARIRSGELKSDCLEASAVNQRKNTPKDEALTEFK